MAILYSVHGHVEACLLGTGHMEGGIATIAMALYTRAQALLLADVAGEAPASRRYGLNRIYVETGEIVEGSSC